MTALLDPRGTEPIPKVSLTRAAALAGVDRHTLRAAIEAGRVPAERVERPGLGPRGVGYLIDPRALENLPRCRYDGCARGADGGPAVALGASGGCEKHGHALEAMGKKRPPEVGKKISAAKLGKPRPDQAQRLRKWPDEECFCGVCGASLGIQLGHIINEHRERGMPFFCERAHEHEWYRANRPERYRLRGRQVACVCGKVTRYRSPSQLGITHCTECFATTPETRALKSASTRARLETLDGQAQLAAMQSGRKEWWGAVRAKLAKYKREHGLLETAEVAELFRVSAGTVTAYYVPCGLPVERHEIDGAGFHLYPAAEVKRFRREWVLALEGHGRRSMWFNPDHVVAQFRARGYIARLAKSGLSEREVEEAIRKRVRSRRKHVLPAGGGSPRKTSLLAREKRWADLYEQLAPQLQAEHDERSELGLLDPNEEPNIYLAMAERDFAQHRDDWADYLAAPGDPIALHRDESRRAANRLRKSLKALQILRNETIPA